MFGQSGERSCFQLEGFGSQHRQRRGTGTLPRLAQEIVKFQEPGLPQLWDGPAQ